MSGGDAYVARIKEMIASIRAFKESNAGEIKIQFNFPQNVALIGDLRTACKEGYISTNLEGQRLLDVVTNRGDTVLMLKCALEFAFERRNT